MRDDRRWYENAALAARRRMYARFHDSGQNLDRKFWIALALYAVLALLVWFTMDAGKVMVMGRPVELRMVPLVIIAGLAVKTVLARQADRFRRSGGRQTEKL